MKRLEFKLFILVSCLALLMAGILSGEALPARTQALPPPTPVSSHIQAPENHTFTPVNRAQLQPSAPDNGLKAIAIVGEVGSSTGTYKSDMDGAVQALQNHGVTVHKFYYGEGTYTWADIVAAAQGAQFILYMGHGVYNGSMPYPNSVGGFYLGPGQFISADQIRTDWADWLAEDSAMIFSHACFTAGSAGGDPDQLPLSEAERRVKMYAGPFVDIGMQTYFANNYFNSAANFVNKLLTDIEQRQNNGDIFKSQYPYRDSEFHDLSYPETGYDLWLSGNPEEWSHAFVGMPSHVFAGDQYTPPTLGSLPTELHFTYDTVAQSLTPASHTLTPENTTTEDALTWQASVDASSAAWLSVTPATGTTPQGITVSGTNLDTLTPGHHEGTITVQVTDPGDTENAVQTISVTLEVQTPTLGGLPDHITFTYAISQQAWLPNSYTLTPRNVGGDQNITWQAEATRNLLLDRTMGQTPQSLVVTPFGFGSMSLSLIGPLAQGTLTVTATAPTGTLNSPHIIAVDFVSQTTGGNILLPIVVKNFG